MTLFVLAGQHSKKADAFAHNIVRELDCIGYMLYPKLNIADYVVVVAEAQYWAIVRSQPVIVYYTTRPLLLSRYREAGAHIIWIDSVPQHRDDVSVPLTNRDTREIIAAMRLWLNIKQKHRN